MKHVSVCVMHGTGRMDPSIGRCWKGIIMGKPKKRARRWFVPIVLLSLLSAFYLQGWPSALEPAAHARLGGGGCPEGSFCGRIVEGTGTACDPSGCCPELYFACNSQKVETVDQFPNVVSANMGNCILTGPEMNACKFTSCLGNDCDPGPCTPTGSISFATRFHSTGGEPCGGLLK